MAVTLDKLMARANRGRTLVVGAKVYDGKVDRRTFYPEAIGVDLFEGEGVDLVHDLEQPLPADVAPFDHVDCVSVLEHCQRPWLMAQHLEDAMRPGASILVSVPCVWRVHAYPGDYWRILPEALPVLFPRVRWQITGVLTEGRLKKGPISLETDIGPYFSRSETVGVGHRV
jgi:SAM-dependent methyltransferase